jgi:hypothetical protein
MGLIIKNNTEEGNKKREPASVSGVLTGAGPNNLRPEAESKIFFTGPLEHPEGHDSYIPENPGLLCLLFLPKPLGLLAKSPVS